MPAMAKTNASACKSYKQMKDKHRTETRRDETKQSLSAGGVKTRIGSARFGLVWILLSRSPVVWANVNFVFCQLSVSIF